MEAEVRMSAAEIVQLLSSTRFFGGLSPVYLRRIAEIGREEVYATGHAIFHEGDIGDKFFLIVDGAVRISRPCQTHITAGACP